MKALDIKNRPRRPYFSKRMLSKKLDKKNRLYIPKWILNESGVNPSKPMYIYKRNDHSYVLDNAKDFINYYSIVGKVSYNKGTIYFSKKMQKSMGIKDSTCFVVFPFEHKIIIIPLM